MADMDFEERARAVIELEADSLRQMAARIDTSFGEAVKLLRSSLEKRGKVVIIGVGKSGNVGQ